LFFSNLPMEYIKFLIQDKKYKNIIEHPNYNPRVIKSMTFNLNTNLVSPNDYYNNFIGNLENPELIWKHAFENQITDLSRCLLYILLFTKERIGKNELIKSTTSLIRTEPLMCSYSPNRSSYSKSLKELENTFIEINRAYKSDDYLISFQNPSVKDFLLNYVKDDRELIKIILRSLIYFNQFFTVFGNEEVDPKNSTGSQSIKLTEEIKEIIQDRIINEFDSLEYYNHYQRNQSNSYKVFQKIIYLDKHYSYDNENLNKLLGGKVGTIVLDELDDWDDKEILVRVIDKTSKYLTLNLNDLYGEFVGSLYHTNDIWALINLIDIYPDEYSLYENTNHNYIISQIKNAIDEEIFNMDKDAGLIETLIDDIEQFEKEFNGNFIAQKQQLFEELEEQSFRYNKKVELNKFKDESVREHANSVERIDSMFNSLLR
jgi:hypothetical protein